MERFQMEMDFVVTSNGIRSNNITLQNKILQQNGKHNIDFLDTELKEKRLNNN